MTITYTYEDLMVEKLLKEAIIEQAKAAYRDINPHNTIYEVVIDWPHDCQYEAHLVSFQDATSLKCMRFVAESHTRDAASNTPKAALEDLLHALRYDVFDRH